jgi:hypothetical protein
MSKKEIIHFNNIQMVEMQKHRWIESEKKGKDLGELAYLDWIKKHAKKFRDEFFGKTR